MLSPHYRRNARYVAAVLLTALAAMLVTVVDVVLSFPPFLIFALAAGFTVLFCGIGPCILSISLSALVSDFLFLQPRYELSLNGTTAALTAIYATCALFSRITAYWKTS
jgi:K+-sensing histidine kinase KdpD